MVTVKVLFRIHLFLTLNMATCHNNFIYFVFFCVQVQKKGVAKPPDYSKSVRTELGLLPVEKK